MDWKDILASMRPKDDETIEEIEIMTAETTSAAERQTGKLNVVVERKGRGGKTATIIEGFTLPADEVSELAAQMKQRFGCGGSARGGEILLQGDRRAQTVAYLKSLNFNIQA